MSTVAETLFHAGWNCSQSVFGAHAEGLGIPRETAFRLASGLGAGMGRKQEVCGAVTGGLLAISLRYGHIEPEDQDGKETSYRLVREFQDRFASVHGSTSCRTLLGVDLQTDQGRKLMKEKDLVNQVCLRCVGTADRLVSSILKENP